MSKLYIIGLSALTTLAILVGVFSYISARERKLVEAEQVKKNLTAIGERVKDNERIKRYTVPDLCRELDGVWRNGRCE